MAEPVVKIANESDIAGRARKKKTRYKLIACIILGSVISSVARAELNALSKPNWSFELVLQPATFIRAIVNSLRNAIRSIMEINKRDFPRSTVTSKLHNTSLFIQ